MSAAIVRCARALVDGEEQNDFSFAVAGGRIAAVAPFAALKKRFPHAHTSEYGPDVAILPGLVNGHSHAYQILLRGWADDLTFERWRSNALYKVVPHLTPDEIHWTFVRAFDEMLAAGITAVAEFFYLNGAGNEHAEAAIEAARESGIRLLFARTWMDAPSAPDAFRETIDCARERTEALMAAHPDIPICVAPHSLHAASPEMVTAAAEFAREHDCMLHVHVAEAQYEVTQTLEKFGVTPIVLLDRLGALNERTVAVHAIYVSASERDLLAQTGARVIHNPMTNQYLGDGICDVAALQRLGVPIGLGTDADVKPSIFDEMRAAALLQKTARLDGSVLPARSAFALGTAEGARALGIDAGDLREGAWADYIVVDVSRVDPWSPLCSAIVHRAETGWVRETYVGGIRRPARVHALAPPPKSLLSRLQLA